MAQLPHYAAKQDLWGSRATFGSSTGCSSKQPERDRAAEFFGVTEASRHVANECRIVFWADSPGEVDGLAQVIVRAGTRNVEDPGYHEGPGYYAVFFEDPSGNRLEICHRTEGA